VVLFCQSRKSDKRWSFPQRRDWRNGDEFVGTREWQRIEEQPLTTENRAVRANA